MATEANRVPVQEPRRQFTLGRLFSFVAASGVYFWMIASLRSLFWLGDPEFVYRGRAQSPWGYVIAVPVTWGVLWLFYRRWRLRQASFVHFSGLVLCLGLLGLVVIVGGLKWLFSGMPWGGADTSWVNVLVRITPTAAWVGCGLGAAVSFPAAAVMLAYRCLYSGPSPPAVSARPDRPD